MEGEAEAEEDVKNVEVEVEGEEEQGVKGLEYFTLYNIVLPGLKTVILGNLKLKMRALTGVS